MMHLLDNISWHALAGPHARYSAGSDDARRYAAGFPPILGFPRPEQPDFGALVPVCEPGEHFYVLGWSGSAPTGWQVGSHARRLQTLTC